MIGVAMSADSNVDMPKFRCCFVERINKGMWRAPVEIAGVNEYRPVLASLLSLQEEGFASAQRES